MPDLPSPDPPAEQVALRSRVEAVLQEYRTVASYAHQDRFWESANRREAVYGWGTVIKPRSRGKGMDVWFDGLDNDISLSADNRWGKRPIWHEWRDLSDLSTVLDSVEGVIRELLNDYR
ncbi:hypothetical protein [Blastococcus xanthinilyticus]|nr:hypothetical protein [Blastococcus xanthinilyticus]